MSFIAARLDKTLLHELQEGLGRRVDVLAHGSGPEVTVVATRDLLALRKLGEWEWWGWEQVLRGSWRAEESAFSWTAADGRWIEAKLDSVGRLPELFRERVQASTVATESHDLTRGRVEIVGRRRLDGSDEITWYASASGGASLDDDATAAFVVDRTDALKADWA